MSDSDWEARRQALGVAMGLPASPANIERVARQTSPEAARWAFTQWELRRRARAKFARAEEMLFEREALEQATHEVVAAYHASKFPPGALVADLTCGIGGDLMALAARGPTVGFEIDAERAACARHNAPDADVRQEHALAAAWTWDYAVADPSRRANGRRTLEPRDFEPDPFALAERMARLRLGLMKLSPMLPDQVLDALGTVVEFVSFGRECREALVLTGTEAPQGRWAVHVESGERLPSAYPAKAALDRPSAWIYDPDPAAVRAQALGALCAAEGLASLGSHGYLTGDHPIASPWVRGYRCLWHGELKRCRVAARNLGVRPLEVKVRGTKIDSAQVARTADPGSGRKVPLLVYAAGRSIRAAWVDPR